MYEDHYDQCKRIGVRGISAGIKAAGPAHFRADPGGHGIREDMEPYQRERLRPVSDLRGFRPRSVGKVLKPLDNSDDLLSEMAGSDS